MAKWHPLKWLKEGEQGKILFLGVMEHKGKKNEMCSLNIKEKAMALVLENHSRIHSNADFLVSVIDPWFMGRVKSTGDSGIFPSGKIRITELIRSHK